MSAGFWIGMAIGAMCGTSLGLFVAALLRAAHDADEHAAKTRRDRAARLSPSPGMRSTRR